MIHLLVSEILTNSERGIIRYDYAGLSKLQLPCITIRCHLLSDIFTIHVFIQGAEVPCYKEYKYGIACKALINGEQKQVLTIFR